MRSDGPRIGEILRAWRKAHDLRQDEAAVRLGWSQPYISQIERGQARLGDVQQLRHLQRTLDIPAEELGLVDQPSGSAPSRWNGRSADEETDGPRVESQRTWRAVRTALNRERPRLTEAAARLYPDAVRVASSTLISRSDWLLPEPVALEDVRLEWQPDVSRASLDGTEPGTSSVRPLSDRGTRYSRYSHAVRDLARPMLFENRPGYRLTGVTSGTDPALRFGYTSYFESVMDISAALAHEFAAASLPRSHNIGELPFRALVGDAFDLDRRAVLPSINTLTIRRAATRHTFWLHYRDPASVATAAGSYHVMPAGVFQPSSIAPSHRAEDFSLWRSSMREFAEEFLNLEEADGSGPQPIDYGAKEPFVAMDAARAAGQFQMWYYGVGLDPLTLCGEILSVAVVDEEAFDQLFSDLSASNQEGSLVSSDQERPTAGIEFTAANVERLLDGEPLAPPAAALLGLAWRDRWRLLG